VPLKGSSNSLERRSIEFVDRLGVLQVLGLETECGYDVFVVGPGEIDAVLPRLTRP
jgi:hypothetical protein